MAYNVFTYRFRVSGLAVAQTQIYLLCPSGHTLRVMMAKLTNRSVTTAEQLAVALLRVPAAGIGTPAGTDISALYEPAVAGENSPIATALGALSAEPTTPDPNPLDEDGVPNTLGYLYIDDDRASHTIVAGDAVALKLLANPSNAFNSTALLRVKVF